jgi:hypothetical protein
MGPYLIPRHLAICENRKEGIDGVVGERPAILRESRCSFFPVLSVMHFFASVLCFQVVAVDLQVIGFVHGEFGKCRSSCNFLIYF